MDLEIEIVATYDVGNQNYILSLIIFDLIIYI